MNDRPNADTAGTRLEARLVYDTRAQALPTGIRAAVKESARRLLFEAGEFEVLIRVSTDSAPAQFSVVGQVLSDGIPLTGAAVRLEGPAAGEQRTDRTGGFKLPELVSGEYQLEIDGDGEIISIPALTLKAA